MKKFLFAAAAVLMMTVPAAANDFPPGCGAIEEVKQKLVDRYGETSAMVSDIRNQENVVVGQLEIWISDDFSTGSVIRIVPHPLVPTIMMGCLLNGMWDIQPSGPELTPDPSPTGDAI